MKIGWSLISQSHVSQDLKVLQGVTTQLDDGWPESVEEEQGLLLLVWRHHLTKQYIKDML